MAHRADLRFLVYKLSNLTFAVVLPGGAARRRVTVEAHPADGAGLPRRVRAALG